MHPIMLNPNNPDEVIVMAHHLRHLGGCAEKSKNPDSRFLVIIERNPDYRLRESVTTRQQRSGANTNKPIFSGKIYSQKTS